MMITFRVRLCQTLGSSGASLTHLYRPKYKYSNLSALRSKPIKTVAMVGPSVKTLLSVAPHPKFILPLVLGTRGMSGL